MTPVPAEWVRNLLDTGGIPLFGSRPRGAQRSVLVGSCWWTGQWTTDWTEDSQWSLLVLAASGPVDGCVLTGLLERGPWVILGWCMRHRGGGGVLSAFVVVRRRRHSRPPSPSPSIPFKSPPTQTQLYLSAPSITTRFAAPSPHHVTRASYRVAFPSFTTLFLSSHFILFASWRPFLASENN